MTEVSFDLSDAHHRAAAQDVKRLIAAATEPECVKPSVSIPRFAVRPCETFIPTGKAGLAQLFAIFGEDKSLERKAQPTQVVHAVTALNVNAINSPACY